MRSHLAAAIRRGALLLPAALLVLPPIGSLRAQDDSATLAAASSTADPASQANAAVPADTASQGSVTTSDTNVPSDSSSSDSTESQSFGAGVEGLQRASSLPPGAFGETPPGIPYSSILSRPGVDLNNINTLQGSPFQSNNIYDPVKLGNLDGSLSFGSFNTGGNPIPFVHPGTEPDDADIKAGPFFVKFHYLNGIVLYDDNYRRTETDRRSELLVLLRLNLSVIAQLSDNLQFSISGSIEYLPIQNQFGVQTAAYGNLGLFLYAAPAFTSQVNYDTIIAGWPVVFADNFRASTGSYSNNAGDNYDLFQGDFLQRDQDGRYTFHSSPNLRSNTSSLGQNTSIDNGVDYFSNTISAATNRFLPGDVLFTAGVSHEDLWYNQSNRGLPPGRDDLYATLSSERNNMRFKPYATYDASYVEGNPGITQTIQGGIRGPIDDQIYLNASAGIYIDAFNHDGILYHLSLNHTAGPYTSEQVSVDRFLSTFNQEQITSEYYKLNQILGPTLSGDLFLAHSDFSDLTGDGGPNHTDDLGGLEFTWNVGPKTDLVLASIFNHQQFGGGERIDTTSGRIILNRIITDDLTFQLFYQYLHSTSNRPGDTFLENVVYFSIVKYL
jgi:hypothetical protein